jgi:small GTP-binding protein
VFLLRLTYHEHEVRRKLPVDDFAVLDRLSPITLVEYLLKQDSFWAAENVLEVCFRRTGTGVYVIELQKIWSSIEWFFGKSEDECRTWAQIAVLQTFHEGCLRRKLTDITASGVHLTWSWDQGLVILEKLITLAKEQSGQEVWEHSRSRIRQDLILLDRFLWQDLRTKDFSREGTALYMLNDLNKIARDNCDERLLCGVRWRIEVLVNCKDPDAISDTNGYIALPKHIYQIREGLIQRLDPAKRNTIILESRGTVRDLKETTSSVSDLTDNEATKSYKTILLLGKTGTGKSTLLRTITDRYAATSNSQATTFGVQEEGCTREDGTQYRVIDTPGFGDPDFSDYQTFERICNYLGQKSVAVRGLDCLFYLIDVSSNRIEGSDLRQAEAFKRLVGDNGWGNVFFVLTRFVANAGNDAEKLRQKNHQALMYQEWDKVFLEEVKKGARFIGLGLDFGDKTELEHLDAKTVVPQEEEEYGFINMSTIAPSGDESDSSAGKHAYRPASFKQGMYRNRLLSVSTDCCSEAYS